MSNFDDIFESVPQTDEFDKEAWAAKKKAERDEVYALADATAETICTDGSRFRDYLDVQAAFRNYSATNALLILATKPDARRLGDKDFWRDQGVYMLSNSEFVVMLNQAFSDRAKLSKLLNISDEQMSYVTNADAGCGLIKYGSALVPFINRFPKDTELYRLMTTRPGEGVFGSGNAS